MFSLIAVVCTYATGECETIGVNEVFPTEVSCLEVKEAMTQRLENSGILDKVAVLQQCVSWGSGT